MNNKMITMPLNEYESYIEELDNFRSGKIKVEIENEKLKRGWTIWDSSAILSCDYKFYSENELFAEIEKINKKLKAEIEELETHNRVANKMIIKFSSSIFYKLYKFFNRG